MVDYSKIDFAKCKLETLPCLMANGETRQLRVFVEWDAPHGNLVMRLGEQGGLAMAKTGNGSLGWQFTGLPVVSTTDDMIELIERAKEVNTFIAAETARIEAEEDAANWLKIPWQDVRFLTDAGAIVQWKSQREWSVEYKWMPCKSGHDGHADTPEYRADKRTLPAGYDPEKPRWVDVERSDVVRLERAGCAIQRRASDAHDDWMARGFPGDPPSGKCDYRVDAHTLHPGVPLHEEPKPVPKFLTVSSCDVKHLVGLGCSVYVEVAPGGQRSRVYDLVRSATAKYFVDENTLPRGIGISPENPKPVPRPCSKEFALANPAFSEFRTRGCYREYWSEWLSINSGWDGCNLYHFYEFRTTAPEKKKSRVVAETPVTLLGDLHIRFDYEFIKKSMVKESVNKNPRIAIIIDEDS